MHASSRHWALMAESLGIVQPALLPFGMVLHARRRFTTGYQSHWRERTVQGQYLGLAPNTPGGHLVLIPDERDGHKVLLTNTVYPLSSSRAATKPKFRLRTKTSPEFALKPVCATLTSTRLAPSFLGSRLSPGGEWVPVGAFENE